jgi:hypothetical protein
MSEKKEADVVLLDGREIRFDLSRLSLDAWRTFVNPETENEVEDEILGAVIGLSGEDVRALAYVDWRKITLKLLKAVSRPLEDDEKN